MSSEDCKTITYFDSPLSQLVNAEKKALYTAPGDNGNHRNLECPQGRATTGFFTYFLTSTRYNSAMCTSFELILML